MALQLRATQLFVQQLGKANGNKKKQSCASLSFFNGVGWRQGMDV